MNFDVQNRSHLKGSALFVATCILSFSVLALLLYKFNGITEIWGWFNELNLYRVAAVLAGFLVGTVNLAILGLRFSFSMSLFGIQERIGTLVLVQAAGCALCSFLPAGTGYEMARIGMLRSFAESRRGFVQALAFDRAVPLALYISLFVALFPYWAPRFLMEASIYTYVVATLLAVFAMLILVIILGPRILTKLSLDSGEGYLRLREIIGSTESFKTLFTVLVLAACNYFLAVLCYYCYMLAIPGGDIPIQLICLFPLAIGLIALVPFTLNGIGLREAFLVYCFSQAGNTSAGVQFSFILMLGTIYGVILGLLAIWWHARTRMKSSA